MREIAPNYYVFDKSTKDSWFEYFKRFWLMLNWALFSFVKRVLINIALGPNEVKLQNPVHVMFTSDDKNAQGIAIVNLLPPKSRKSPQSYFDQAPPFFFKQKYQQLVLSNPKHKAYIDAMINEIGRLLHGKSEQDKCVGKTFTIENIHIKGLERLDKDLATYFQEQIRQRYKQDFFIHLRTLNLNFYTLETSDGALLESVKVSLDHDLEKPISERKFIIACMARNQNYMYWLKDFYISAQKIGCTVIGFNYRGIDFSKGMAWTEEDLVNDVLTQAQHLIELGVNPENIAIEGMSSGGAIATMVAAKMHDKGWKVKLYNERSYRSFLRLMVGYVMPSNDSSLCNPLNWLRYVIAGLSYIILAPVLWLQGWHLNAASAWDRIPYAYKTYSVARNHQDPEQYDDDDLVHDSYSSIASLMYEHAQEAQQKQQRGAMLTAEEELLLTDKTESHEFTLDRSIEANTNPSAHAAPRRFLFNTHSHGQTMQEYMIECMRQKFGAMV